MTSDRWKKSKGISEREESRARRTQAEIEVVVLAPPCPAASFIWGEGQAGKLFCAVLGQGGWRDAQQWRPTAHMSEQTEKDIRLRWEDEDGEKRRKEKQDLTESCGLAIKAFVVFPPAISLFYLLVADNDISALHNN
jgi:hypothetical protein